MSEQSISRTQQMKEQGNEQAAIQVVTPERAIAVATRVAVGTQTEFDAPVVTPQGEVLSHIIPGSD